MFFSLKSCRSSTEVLHRFEFALNQGRLYIQYVEIVIHIMSEHFLFFSPCKDASNSHWCSGDCSGDCGSILCSTWQISQSLQTCWTTVSNLGQQTYVCASAFILTIPGCPWCNSFNTALFSLVGPVTRVPHMTLLCSAESSYICIYFRFSSTWYIHPSMTERRAFESSESVLGALVTCIGYCKHGDVLNLWAVFLKIRFFPEWLVLLMLLKRNWAVECWYFWCPHATEWSVLLYLWTVNEGTFTMISILIWWVEVIIF